MTKQTGEHPRFGATDVCILMPIANISMEETAKYAHQLGKRVGEELGISRYFYENATTSNDRKNLATVRSGEYQGLKEKLSNPNFKPDFGPTEYNKQIVSSGATAISARDFLITYNVNLNSTSTRRENAIAFDIRENGRAKLVDGKKVLNKISDNEKIKIAIRSLGLDDLKPFNPQERIIEYVMNSNTDKKLIDFTVKDFEEETASESMTPCLRWYFRRFFRNNSCKSL